MAWTISLSGDISDPDVGTGIPGSGVETDEVVVRLVDTTGSILNGAAQRATVNGNTWSIDYETHGTRPAGTYIINVTAKDIMGNETTTDAGTISLDARPPDPEIYGRLLPEDMISTNLVLSGTVGRPAELGWWGGGVSL